VCYVKQVGNGRNGWLKTFRGCKGEEKKKRLDEDKKGSSKEEDKFVFGENYGNLNSK